MFSFWLSPLPLSHEGKESYRFHHHVRYAPLNTPWLTTPAHWLKQMDNECVCDLLVRLPPLLAKPAHNYTVFVDESCIVTYTCGGRLMS
ncbi:hypothetical protein HID58_026727 [Brassica napus]|uniref:Uncharacterized protein n=1 Tax=Brassica napus TaxID=3708 RepID=A0ABQ8CPR5_BRANA|nr:hypothetical protein HID58_026727 [Brassica napus]